MATLDQLPPDRRAVLELLLRRRQTYEAIAGLLGMDAARVRELAAEALFELAPSSARRLEPEWREQLADYALRQQTGPEAAATRGHLRRSEPARTWLASLLDSLDPLYGEGERPQLPRAADAPARAPRPAPAPMPAPSRRAPAPAPAETPAPSRRAPAPAPPLRAPAPASAPTPAPRWGVIAAAIAVLALGSGGALAAALIAGGDGGEDGGGRAERGGNGGDRGLAGAGAGSTGQGGARFLGRTTLRPLRPGSGSGVAVVAQRGERRQLLVQAKLEPSSREDAYEVWLFNSPGDARSLGGQIANRRGEFRGAGVLPEDFARFRFIDISREKVDGDVRHSGRSVLRGPLGPALGRR